MSKSGFERLSTLSELNRDPNWVNQDVYRLMYREDLYVAAYERIKSKPGNMTPGVDGSTLDGFSLRTIEGIIKAMRDESFQFSAGRRVRIPKKDGKTRPLTVAPPREKVVQEVMRMVLEAIYDGAENPTFLDCSHGFRANRGPHTALKEIRGWKATSWFVEGDIKGCFDNIDHEVLITLLRKRIRDERFLNLVWKALKAGYMEFKKLNTAGSLGTPQGSIVSPILANVYLHELDLFAMRLVKEFEKGSVRKINPEYKRLQSKKLYWKQKGNNAEEVAELARMMRKIPAMDTNDPNFCRVNYIRYADDWIVGVSGPRDVALKIREKVGVFLKENLKLDLSIEKTHIRHARTEDAFFLGTNLRNQSVETQKVSLATRNGQTYRQRSTGMLMTMKAPVARIVESLKVEGFCNHEGEPIAKLGWINYDPHDILMRFNAVFTGIVNYWSFADNYGALSRIEYIILHSCAKTLAAKYRMGSRRKVFAKYGRDLRIVTEADGKLPRVSSFRRVTSWRRDPIRFLIGEVADPSPTKYWSKYTRSRLFLNCLICQSSEGVEMHHLRHVRKMGETLRGFAKQMALINRKQIPVCNPCHVRIHNGEYDGVNLKLLAETTGNVVNSVASRGVA